MNHKYVYMYREGTFEAKIKYLLGRRRGIHVHKREKKRYTTIKYANIFVVWSQYENKDLYVL